MKVLKLSFKLGLLWNGLFSSFGGIAAEAIPFAAFGGIEEHFKTAEGKDGFHQMKNIDFIYTINLDQRPEKFASCVQQLEKYGISPYRFSAVNGWELTLEQINQLGVVFEPGMSGGTWGTWYEEGGDKTPHHEPVQAVGRNYFCHCMSPGAIGIVLSHLSILQDAFDSGYETIWVMEDDIEIVRDPHLLSALIEQLDALAGKENWDVLFTDPDTKNREGRYVPCSAYAWRPNYAPEHPAQFAEKAAIGADLRKVGARYGAYSMIVRRSGMEKILSFFKKYKIFLPYDMEYTQPPGIKLYTVLSDVVSTQPMALTDNGAPNYLKRDGNGGSTDE